MIFEFLTVVELSTDTDVVTIIQERLAEVLDEAQGSDSFDTEAVKRMIIPRSRRMWSSDDEKMARNLTECFSASR